MKKIIIVGGGFTGLTMAYLLSKYGNKVILIESEDDMGGLAGTFKVGGQKLEKFYHHWFTNDVHIMKLINDLGLNHKVRIRETRTGMYYSNNFYKLSKPLDLLRFTPLSFFGRLRLGLLALKARTVTNWRRLESVSAKEWLMKMAGEEVYKIVWEPLLRGKFGKFESKISAVWMWNKLKLRGSSRGKKGEEQLAYFEGGFADLITFLTGAIIENNGEIVKNTEVSGILVNSSQSANGVIAGDQKFFSDYVVLTTPLPIAAKILKEQVSEKYFLSLNKIDYLSNVCIVLELDRSLSDTYWLNVNDPNFPFVAVIEHTNFESKKLYNDRHIIYLSKYLLEDEFLYKASEEDIMQYTTKHLKEMFPEFKKSWIIKKTIWKGRYSQPIVVKEYSKLIPSYETEIKNIFLNTMAQIYPEDRVTNYAVRQGYDISEMIQHRIQSSEN